MLIIYWVFAPRMCVCLCLTGTHTCFLLVLCCSTDLCQRLNMLRIRQLPRHQLPGQRAQPRCASIKVAPARSHNLPEQRLVCYQCTAAWAGLDRRTVGQQRRDCMDVGPAGWLPSARTVQHRTGAYVWVHSTRQRAAADLFVCEFFVLGAHVCSASTAPITGFFVQYGWTYTGAHLFLIVFVIGVNARTLSWTCVRTVLVADALPASRCVQRLPRRQLHIHRRFVCAVSTGHCKRRRGCRLERDMHAVQPRFVFERLWCHQVQRVSIWRVLPCF